MSGTTEYLQATHRALVQSPIVKTYVVVRQRIASQEGYLRVRIDLSNDDFLEAAEFFHATPDGVQTKDYSYQWMDGTRTRLIKRWDSKPHYPQLSNFPYHCHDGSEGNVIPSERMSMQEILVAIQHDVGES